MIFMTICGTFRVRK